MSKLAQNSAFSETLKRHVLLNGYKKFLQTFRSDCAKCTL